MLLHDRLAPDFLDRIGIFKLRLPALREIPEDVPWLWRSAYAQALDRSGRRLDVMPFGDDHHEEVGERLSQRPLPGNMRDLLRVAYRLIAARLPVDGEPPMSDVEAVQFALEEEDVGTDIDVSHDSWPRPTLNRNR